jgi:hypothetical protein
MSLPDNVEMWCEPVASVECEHCGVFEIPDSHSSAVDITELACPSCERQSIVSITRIGQRDAWWFWFCLPGCLPDSSVYGPYTTEEEAIEEARELVGEDEDEEEEAQ